MSGGPHIVTAKRPGKTARHYVYAWRGGPQIFTSSGGAKPKITGDIIDAIGQARAKRAPNADGTVKGLIARYRGSPEWEKLSKSTKPTWLTWLGRIEDEFGKARLAVFEDRRVRGDILGWRDKWQSQPRSADMAIQVLSRLLSWAVDRGQLSINNAKGISQLYESNRSDIIWTADDFEAFRARASVEVQEGVELAACTGLRRADLVTVPWDAVGEHAIVWQTSKSGGRARIVVPLLPETKALLRRIKHRHEAAMAALPLSKRKKMPTTILANSRWGSWTPMGFGSRFNDAKRESRVGVNLHDLRGTFATRCMIAGLTDQEIADILGWSAKDIATIRVKYVDQARVVIALAERISRGSVNQS